ncbi:MAG TPA: carboxypeptidase regulatory-like domain-containing protein, partial [Pyrinomonadaceae bacterium]
MRSFHITKKNHPVRFGSPIISRGLLVVLAALVSWQTAPGQGARPVAAPEQSPSNAVGTQEGGRSASVEARRQPQQGTAGIIKGRVVSDRGRPLANASVVARAIGSARAIPLSATDAEGNFELTGLATTVYLVSAFAPGYVTDAGATPQSGTYARPGESIVLKMVKGGVITGQVVDVAGKPLVAARVHVLRVRDAQGQPLRLDRVKRFAPTDDRGIYRHYGLEPGAYLVSVSGSSIFNLSPASSGDEPPSYYPASTRSTALEVAVSEGQEVGGIDIQQRPQRGYAISGYLSGVPKTGDTKNITVALVNTANGATEALLDRTSDQNAREFTFYSVPEGDYELMAQSNLGTADAAIATARRVSVKGKDVGPVELTLQALGSVAGRLVLEAARSDEANPACTGRRNSRLEESVIQVRRSGAERTTEPLHSALAPASGTAPDAKGSFILRDLPAGRYFLQLDLPDTDWFVRNVTASGVAANRAQAFDASSNALTLAPGARLEGLTVNLGVGAASLHGRVTTGPEGTNMPARMRVYMVPAMREQAGNVLRYAAAPVQSDGTFSFEHVAPGAYRLVARAVA